MLGFSYQYLMASGAKVRLSMAVPELPPDVAWHQTAGWRAMILPEPVKLAQLERVAVRVSSLSRLVAAVSVETSDFAYFVGAKSGDISFRVVLEDLAAQDSREGSWALEQCAALADSPIWRFDAARRVVAWAAEVPKAVAVEEVLALLNKDWVLATEAASEFTDLIGVPDVADDWLG